MDEIRKQEIDEDLRKVEYHISELPACFYLDKLLLLLGILSLKLDFKRPKEEKEYKIKGAWEIYKKC